MAALIVALILIGTVGPAVAAGVLELLHILIVVAIVILSVAVAAGVTAVAVWCHRRAVRAPARRTALPVVIRELGPQRAPAIEPPRLLASSADLTDAAAELASLRADLAAYRAERRRAGWPPVAPYRPDPTGGDR